MGIIHIIKHYTGIILLYECYECLMVEQVKKCSCSFFFPPRSTISFHVARKEGGGGECWGNDGFSGQDIRPFPVNCASDEK